MVGVKEIARTAAVTAHVWQDDADYVMSCTDNGFLIMSAPSEVTQKLAFPKVRFSKMQFHKEGLVLTTEDNQYYIF